MPVTNHQIDEVRDLLCASVPDVFSTMLTMEALPLEPFVFPVAGEPMVAASVGFVGEANGVVYLHLRATLAAVLAGQMLGMSAEELAGDDDTVNDVVGELSNMVVGAVKSRLCDEGSPCSLTIPSIVRGVGMTVSGAGHPARRLFGFRCGGDAIVIELLMQTA